VCPRPTTSNQTSFTRLIAFDSCCPTRSSRHLDRGACRLDLLTLPTDVYPPSPTFPDLRRRQPRICSGQPELPLTCPKAMPRHRPEHDCSSPSTVCTKKTYRRVQFPHFMILELYPQDPYTPSASAHAPSPYLHPHPRPRPDAQPRELPSPLPFGLPTLREILAHGPAPMSTMNKARARLRLALPPRHLSVGIWFLPL